VAVAFEPKLELTSHFTIVSLWPQRAGQRWSDRVARGSTGRATIQPAFPHSTPMRSPGVVLCCRQEHKQDGTKRHNLAHTGAVIWRWCDWG